MKKYIFFALFAALLYGLSAPLSKILLSYVDSVLLASFLYLGAGIGILFISLFLRINKTKSKEKSLGKKDLIYIFLMVILDIIAPILLLLGLKTSNPENISLLNSFEIVATSLIAFVFFKEAISKRMWLAIVLIFLASLFLSFNLEAMNFSFGSILALLASICWGLENNATRKLSDKNPYQIVIIKGFGSGIGSLVIALVLGFSFPKPLIVFLAMLLGFFAYGLSIFFYVKAQKVLKASKTSAYYAFAPFIGVALSLIIFRELPSVFFFLGLVLMIIGIIIVNKDLSLSERVDKNEGISD